MSQVERDPYADLPMLEPPRSSWRGVAVWVLGVLLLLDIGALLFALSFANVTAEGPAKRTLRNSAAILTEVDAYLDDQYDSLRQQAEQQPDRPLTPPDYPIAVTFTADEVLASDREEFRGMLLDRSADALYAEGTDAIVSENDNDSDFSTQAAVRDGMNVLRERQHDGLTVATIVLAAGAGVLALGLLLIARGYAGLLGLGIGVFLGSLPFLVLAIAVRFAFRLAADATGDSFVEEYLKLGQELTWAPIRNGIVFTVGSAAVIVMGAALARWGRTAGRAY
ncbi:MAG: hypothetical protein WEE64_01110 [Dehalococcoidia bacterium]